MNFILLYQKCVVPLPVVRLRLKVSLCSRPPFVSIQRRGFPCRSSYLWEKVFRFPDEAGSLSEVQGDSCQSRPQKSVNVKSPAETQRSSPLAFTFSPTIIQNRKGVFFYFFYLRFFFWFFYKSDSHLLLISC